MGRHVDENTSTHSRLSPRSPEVGRFPAALSAGP